MLHWLSCFYERLLLMYWRIRPRATLDLFFSALPPILAAINRTILRRLLSGRTLQLPYKKPEMEQCDISRDPDARPIHARLAIAHVLIAQIPHPSACVGDEYAVMIFGHAAAPDPGDSVGYFV